MNVATDNPPAAQRRRSREFIDRVIGAHAEAFDLEQEVPRGVFDALAREGVLGALVPAEYGGTGLDPLAVGLLCEDMGRASASLLSLITVHTMVSLAIARWGSAAQRTRWLPPLARGETLAAFALTEPDVGSDVKSVATRVERKDGGFVITGTKKWISFGQVAGLFFVVGNCEGKLAAFLVERDTPGLVVEPIANMLGFRAAMLAEVRMNECVVAGDSMVGSLDFGFSQIVGSVLDHGRYCIAWGSVGLAQACLDASLDYSEQRTQFGRALKDHQLVQRMIADMIVNTRAARLLCQDAARARAEGGPDMIIGAAVAKYFSGTIVEKLASDAVQIHGANGCSSSYPVQRYLRDAKIMNIIEGSAQMQQMMIAQHAYQRW
ncbi:MAG: acyl-CoA dehydrogenase [Betaproteobacteria bacterium]|nr:acyl-CoA dehydrogenase [Betaproteobacteria bacterium]